MSQQSASLQISFVSYRIGDGGESEKVEVFQADVIGSKPAYIRIFSLKPFTAHQRRANKPSTGLPSSLRSIFHSLVFLCQMLSVKITPLNLMKMTAPLLMTPATRKVINETFVLRLCFY